MMNGQDDTIRAEELEELEEDDEEREPSTYKIWVHIEALDEDGEPIEGDADLPTEICEVDTLDEATDIVAKLEAVDVFAKEMPEAINRDLLDALIGAQQSLVYLAPDRFDDAEHRAAWDEKLANIARVIAKAEGR